VTGHIVTGHILAAGGADIAREATFWILAIAATAAGLGMVLARRAVHCAVLLAVVMLSLAVLYALQGAPFLAFVQVIVYTGAVLMLFLFVLMIVGISSTDSAVETIKGQRLWAGVAGIGLLILLVLVVGHAAIGKAPPASASFGSSNITGIGTLLFTKYVFPFEITSALLITAALGAMVLAHRERLTPNATCPGSGSAAVTRPRCPARAPTRGTTRSTCRPGCRTARRRPCRSARSSPARTAARTTSRRRRPPRPCRLPRRSRPTT
jgi:NADH-quinone oxidoreductase subunit J